MVRLPPQLRVLQGQYGLFMLGNGLSLVGTWMQRIACSWLVWDWTGSAFWLGVLAAADLLPVVLIGPFAGVAADRWDRLRQNRLAQVASTGLALALAGLLALGALSMPLLIFFVALQGGLIAAVQPARLAMAQQMVARQDMSVAVALNSVNVNLARLVGPAVAGLLIVHVEIAWIFVLNAAVTAIFVVLLGRITLSPREAKTAPAGLWLLMAEGLAHVRRSRAIRLIFVMLLLGGMLVRSMLELVPAIAAQTFADTTTGLAALTAAAAAGAVLSGLTISGDSRSLLPGVLAWWSIGALATLVLTRAPHPALALGAAALMGAAITRALVGTQTFVQLSTPDQLRGRVLSLHGLIARSSPALGALAIGLAADHLGLPFAVGVSSVLMLAVVLVTLLALRGRLLRRAG